MVAEKINQQCRKDGIRLKEISFEEPKVDSEEAEASFSSTESAIEVEPVKTIEYGVNNSFNLTDSSGSSEVVMVRYIGGRINLIKKTNPKSPEEKAGYILYTFREDQMAKPDFSYVLQAGVVPVQLDGILTKESRLMLFMAVRDSAAELKVCLQVVHTDTKRFRNLIYSRVDQASIYFQIKAIGSLVDLVMLVGGTSENFLHFRFSTDEKEWAPRIKDDHSKFEISNQLNEVISDFTLQKQTESKLLAGFIGVNGNWNRITVIELNGTQKFSEYRARKLYEISLYCELGSYSSIVLNEEASKVLIAGLFWNKSFSKVSLHLKELENQGKSFDHETQDTIGHTSENPAPYDEKPSVTAPLHLITKRFNEFLNSQASISDRQARALSLTTKTPIDITSVKGQTTPSGKDKSQDQADISKESWMKSNTANSYDPYVVWIKGDSTVLRVMQGADTLTVNRLELETVPELKEGSPVDPIQLVSISGELQKNKSSTAKIMLALSNYMLVDMSLRF